MGRMRRWSTWWDERVVPRLTDGSLKGHEFGEWRRDVCGVLHGQVLEIGFGSGLNVRWWPAGLEVVHAVEPSDLAWQLSRRRRERTRVPVERRGLDGQVLDAPDGCYDSALVTFSLCTIPDPSLALHELRRVLRPGGVVAFVEHGLATDPAVVRWQQRMEPIQRRVAGGCHLTRDPVRMLEQAGFAVDVTRQDYLDGPAVSHPWTWLTAGTARP